MIEPSNDYDVIIIGGGPAGATLGSFLGMSGYRTLIIEKDIHPRDHVGESLSPSTNAIFHRIGFLPKMELAGFVHKPGTGWTGPRTPLNHYVWIRINEAPPPDAVQLHTYNVERDAMDAMLLRHAHELGAHVLQGVTVKRVIFEDGRAVGVRAAMRSGESAWTEEERPELQPVRHLLVVQGGRTEPPRIRRVPPPPIPRTGESMGLADSTPEWGLVGWRRDGQGRLSEVRPCPR